jgi:hypothetical protein
MISSCLIEAGDEVRSGTTKHHIDANEERPTETGTYSNKNRETIAEKRAITMRDYELR